MNFKTLDLSIDNDLQEWKFFISRNSRHFDIFYTHEYLNLFVNKHQKIFISLCEYKDLFWINCFLKTEILNYKDAIKEKIYDIETPYGYGGQYLTQQIKNLSNMQKASTQIGVKLME